MNRSSITICLLLFVQVARGNCFLHIEKGEHRGSQLILYGLKKFTGGLGDDDDRDRGDNHTWQRYFTRVGAGSF